nr:MAG TPA: hypothetical protein [Caudoviricetes sp.]
MLLCDSLLNRTANMANYTHSRKSYFPRKEKIFPQN